PFYHSVLGVVLAETTGAETGGGSVSPLRPLDEPQEVHQRLPPLKARCPHVRQGRVQVFRGETDFRPSWPVRRGCRARRRRASTTTASISSRRCGSGGRGKGKGRGGRAGARGSEPSFTSHSANRSHVDYSHVVLHGQAQDAQLGQGAAPAGPR